MHVHREGGAAVMIVCFVCLCLEQNALLQDKYKFYLPLWRQEMKDNSAIKCPNFSVCTLYHFDCTCN